MEMDLFGLGYSPVAGSCDRHRQTSGSINGREHNVVAFYARDAFLKTSHI
jgi:hypothetical protein